MRYLNFFILLVIGFSNDPSLDRYIVQQSKRLLHKPYLANALNMDREEKLVSREDSFDCVSFVEHVFSRALSLSIENPESADSFLVTLRYRNGKIMGYQSRLHYFSEWLWQAELNGYGKNISGMLHGQPRCKTINYMSTHPSRYPSLDDPQILDGIIASEKKLSDTPFYYIPKKELAAIEKKLAAGDILAFTASTKGLDVIHSGIVIIENQVPKLIHASSKASKVVISKESISSLVMKMKGCDGIIVFRPFKRLIK